MKKIIVDRDVLIDILTSKRIPEGRRQDPIDFVKDKIESGEYTGYLLSPVLNYTEDQDLNRKCSKTDFTLS